MIVVEGPDGAGKTTLINFLSEGLGYPVAPRVVTKDAEALVDLKSWVEENVAGGWQPTIFDRHRLISEPIYGPIIRGEFEPGFNDPEWFEPMLRQFYALNPTLIYCLPPFEVVWENIKNDPDNKVVAKGHTIRAIWGAYFNKAMTDYVHNPKVWVYDYTWEQEADARALMLHVIKKREVQR